MVEVMASLFNSMLDNSGHSLELYFKGWIGDHGQMNLTSNDFGMVHIAELG